CDLDQQVLVEVLDGERVGLQECDVLVQTVELVQGHPPQDAPVHGVYFVIGEIHAGCGPQQFEYRGQVDCLGGEVVKLVLGLDDRMPADPGQLTREPLRRQYVIHAAGQ